MALFLSGYTIQQRTLKDLRSAIRPGATRSTRPSPKAHLPDYFQRNTQEFEDGTVLVEESQADKAERELREMKKYVLHVPKAKVKKESDNTAQKVLKQSQNNDDGPNHDSGDKREATQEQLDMLESIKSHAASKAWGVDHPDPLANNPLPISRAERRRLIKEEIQRLAQADKPLLYQRRLW